MSRITVVTAPTATASIAVLASSPAATPRHTGPPVTKLTVAAATRSPTNRTRESDDRSVGRGQAKNLAARGAPQPEQCLLPAVGLGEGGTSSETQCAGSEYPGNAQQEEKDLRVGGVELGSHQRLCGVVGNQDRARRPALQQRSKLPRPCGCPARVRWIGGVVNGDVGFEADRRQIGGTRIEHRGDTTVGGHSGSTGQHVPLKGAEADDD